MIQHLLLGFLGICFIFCLLRNFSSNFPSSSLDNTWALFGEHSGIFEEEKKETIKKVPGSRGITYSTIESV